MAGSACDIGGAQPTATPGPGMPGAPATGLARWWSMAVGVDTRSLAALRVALGLILLADLWFRAGSLRAFYTDRGLLTRTESITATEGNPFYLSLHMASGGAWFQALLFLTAAALAMMLVVGWRTRLAAVGSWLLLISLHSRNPQVLQGGDVLLRCLLFWAMLLPLHASWSVDRARAPADAAPPRRVANVASLALLLQTCFLYWFSVLLKDHPDWRVDYTAVQYALHIDQLVTPLGAWLREHEGLCRALTRATWWQEAIGPFLVFLPGLLVAVVSLRIAERVNEWARLLAVVLFVGFHLGLALSLELGPFPFICWAAWLPFVPALFWDGLRARWNRRFAAPLQIWFDGECGFCFAAARLMQTFWLLPPHTLRPCQDDPGMLETMRREDSWVVVASDGTRHLRFDAVATVMRHSPLLRPFAWIARVGPVARLGDRAYRSLARNRQRGARVLWFMRPAPFAVPGRRAAIARDLLAGLLLCHVALWNWRTLHIGRPSEAWALGIYPTGENAWLELVRLDQYWSMFAPYPLRDDGWYVAVATLPDGSTVDVLTGAAPTDTAPERPALRYADERWRKYLMNLSTADFAAWRPNYARWLLRRWNARHDDEPERQATSLELVFWRKSNRLGEPPVLTRDSMVTVTP